MIAVTGTVTIEGEGGHFLVTGEGSTVTIDVREQRAGIASLLRAPGIVRTLRLVSKALVAQQLTVRVTRGGKTLATVGGAEPSGLIGRILRIERFRFGK